MISPLFKINDVWIKLSLLESSFGGHALWGYSKTSLRWIFYQSSVFLFRNDRIFLYSVYYWFIIWPIIIWETSSMFGYIEFHCTCKLGQLNLMVSSARFHAACVNKHQCCFNKTLSQFQRPTRTADVTLSVSIHWKML